MHIFQFFFLVDPHTYLYNTLCRSHNFPLSCLESGNIFQKKWLFGKIHFVILFWIRSTLHFKFWEKILLSKVIKYSNQIFFLLFYVSFYISRYHFLWLFTISFNIYLKKDYHKFFFEYIYQNLPPLKAEQPKSTKYDEIFLLMVLEYNRSYLVELPNLIQLAS